MPTKKQIQQYISTEEKRLQHINKAVSYYTKDRVSQIKTWLAEVRELEQLRSEERSWKAKEEISKRLNAKVAYDPSKRLPEFIHAKSPYLAVFTILDEKLGKRTYALGKQNLFNGSKVIVIDWRAAAVSQLYYEYEDGEDYYEVINGTEREGIIQEKLQISVKNSVLTGITSSQVSLVKSKGEWSDSTGLLTSSADRKMAEEDHRLVDIVALISKDQFHEITKNDEGCLYLTGGAGSGKTTVALHRASFLIYNKPEQFREERCLVVMFNRALKEYVQPSVRDLVGEHIQVETFSAWALRAIRTLTNKQAPRIASEDAADAEMAKRSSWLKPLLNQYLLQTSAASGLEDLHLFYKSLSDLWKECKDTKRRKLIPVEIKNLQAAYETIEVVDELSYADLGVYVSLLQGRSHKKSEARAINWYDHIVIDEAQDLSQLELSALQFSTTKAKSLTLCADENQRILSFVDKTGLKNFRHSLTGNEDSGTLEVSYRSTREIMQYSLKVKDAKLTASRRGTPVREELFKTQKAAVAELQSTLEQIQRDSPSSLTAVICRTKGEAAKLYKLLHTSKLNNSSMDLLTYDFKPGVIITNVHQVKGLEFSNVILWDPSEEAYLDTETHRNLLYVAITRACDYLAIFGVKTLSKVLL